MLARQVFDTLLEAKVPIARWRRHKNTDRPHSALGNLAPKVFVRQASARGFRLILAKAERVGVG